jgi:hypothetical protein
VSVPPAPRPRLAEAGAVLVTPDSSVHGCDLCFGIYLVLDLLATLILKLIDNTDVL